MAKDNQSPNSGGKRAPDAEPEALIDHRSEMERLFDNAGPWLGRHWPKLALPLAALALVFGFWSWRNAAAASETANAWKLFRDGDYAALAKRAGTVPAARHAQMRLAEEAMEEGRANLLSDRDAALGKFRAAADLYEAIGNDGAAAPGLRHAALYARGLALECQLAPAAAIEAYKRLQAAPNVSERTRQAAADRIKELSRKSVQEFFRSLADAKTLAPAAAVAPALPPDAKSLDDILKGLENPKAAPAIPAPPADAKKVPPPPPEPAANKADAKPAETKTGK